MKGPYIAEGSLLEQPTHRDMEADISGPEKVMDCVAKALDTDSERFDVRMGNGAEHVVVAELLYR